MNYIFLFEVLVLTVLATLVKYTTDEYEDYIFLFEVLVLTVLATLVKYTTDEYEDYIFYYLRFLF